MRSGWTCVTRFFVALALSCALGACKSGDKASGAKGAAEPGVAVNPKSVQARAKAPPPPNATNRASIGKGRASAQTTNSAGESDLYWVEEIDIDGDGTVEQTELLWDDEDKVLFAYAETDAPCEYGGTAVVALLVGVNGEGNPRGRPAGSGFYAAYLDASECNAGVAGLYGCKFDASGNETDWAGAVVDSAGDSIVFAGESR